MTILAVDDEKLALDHLASELKTVFSDESIHAFQNADDAIGWAEDLAAGEEQLDYAFLDIQLRGMNGLELARRLKMIHPKVSIVFGTGYSEYAMDAFGMCAKGYLLKPIRAKDIRQVLDEMIPNWNDVANPLPKDIRMQTFGHFEVFVNDKPVTFEREKAKELLAYLVDRHGASVTTEQIAAALWEDKNYDKGLKNQASVVVSSLRKSLRAVGIEDILIKTWKHLALDTTKVKCDAYDFEKWDASAVNAFHGEYMAGYSWAEFSTGRYTQMEQEKFQQKKGFFS